MSLPWKTGDVFTFDVDGVTLEAACFGPPATNAPTIVLLHEGLGSVALWRDFPQKLSERTGLGVFAYSRQGYGGSGPISLPRPIHYMNDEASISLPLILDQIGADEVILLGHSDGASIAAIYAGEFSDARVKAVILMAPHFFAEEISVASIADAKISYLSGGLREKLAKYHQDVDGAFLGWNDTWLHPDFMKWNIEPQLSHVTVPVLAIQGREDQYGTLKQMEALEQHVMSDLSIQILENCGHSPHLEQTEKVIQLMGEFVSKSVK